MYTQFQLNMNNNTSSTIYTHSNTASAYNNNNNFNSSNDSIGSSPTISTPFLDSSSIDTPFNSSSPFFDAIDISPYLVYASFAVPHQDNGVRNMNDNKEDVCIARYLDGQQDDLLRLKSNGHPLSFNGDPSLLIIDKSKSPVIASASARKPSPTIVLETVTEEDSDSLFPPLISSQQSTQSLYESDQAVKNEPTLDELLGFDLGSPLTEEESDDDYSLYEEEAQQHNKESSTTNTQQQEQVKEEASTSQQTLRKRKAGSSSTASSASTSSNKRRRISATPASKTSPADSKIYQCPLCDHTSKRRYNLSTHIKTHDRNRIKEFECSQCNKAFDRRHDRDRHLATVHRGERSFNCGHCTSHFSRRDALNRHLIQRHDYDDADFFE